MTPLLSDARLAHQATAGDRRAFAAIYRRHHQGLYRFCLSIVGRPEDAQEALQNTMVKALHSLPGEERELKLKPWLYRVAHNESVDLLRRRREGPELEDQRLASGFDIAETAATRERLGRLLADLAELPERQRSALVMRELAGLGYEQIGETFETSDAVARQTVYEARIALRELEAGREMDCKFVAKQLSDTDGRTARRREIRAHLRACPECRALRDSIDSRQRDLAALAPLPAVAATSLLHGIVGGNATVGGIGSTAGTGAAGASVGKLAATPVTLKAVATVAVVATIGVTAADRGGLIDTGRSGGGHQTTGTHVAPEQGGASAGDTGQGANSRATGVSPYRRRAGARAALARSHSGPDSHLATGATAPVVPAGRGAQGNSPAGGTTEPSSEKGPQGRQNAVGHEAKGKARSGPARGHAKSKAGSSPGNSGNAPGRRHGAPKHSAPPGQSPEGHESGNGKAKGKAHAPGQNKPSEAATSPTAAPPQATEPASEKAEGSGKGEGKSQKPEASP